MELVEAAYVYLGNKNAKSQPPTQPSFRGLQKKRATSEVLHSKESKTKKRKEIKEKGFAQIFSTPHRVKKNLQKDGLGASRGKAARSLRKNLLRASRADKQAKWQQNKTNITGLFQRISLELR